MNLNHVCGVSLLSWVLPALAMAANPIPTLQPGTYVLRRVQTGGFPSTSKPQVPGPCDVVALMTVRATAPGRFQALVQDRVAGRCIQGLPVPANPRIYHFVYYGDFGCGRGYRSLETLTSGISVTGALPVAILNDDRFAPPSCTSPAQGPAIYPVLTLQESGKQGAINWSTF